MPTFPQDVCAWKNWPPCSRPPENKERKKSKRTKHKKITCTLYFKGSFEPLNEYLCNFDALKSSTLNRTLSIPPLNLTAVIENLRFGRESAKAIKKTWKKKLNASYWSGFLFWPKGEKLRLETAANCPVTMILHVKTGLLLHYPRARLQVVAIRIGVICFMQLIVAITHHP